jgi:hypothetical protein
VERFGWRQLAIGNQGDGGRREGRLRQKFTNGAGVRGVKHCARMAPFAAGRNVPAWMTAMPVAAVAVTLSGVLMMPGRGMLTALVMVVQRGGERVGEQIARRHQPRQSCPKHGHSPRLDLWEGNVPAFLTRRRFPALARKPFFDGDFFAAATPLVAKRL